MSVWQRLRCLQLVKVMMRNSRCLKWVIFKTMCPSVSAGCKGPACVLRPPRGQHRPGAHPPCHRPRAVTQTGCSPPGPPAAPPPRPAPPGAPRPTGGQALRPFIRGGAGARGCDLICQASATRGAPAPQPGPVHRGPSRPPPPRRGREGPAPQSEEGAARRGKGLG